MVCPVDSRCSQRRTKFQVEPLGSQGPEGGEVLVSRKTSEFRMIILVEKAGFIAHPPAYSSRYCMRVIKPAAHFEPFKYRPFAEKWSFGILMSSWKLLLLLALVNSVVPDAVVNISGYITCRFPGPFKYRQLIYDSPFLKYLYSGPDLETKRSPIFYNITTTAETNVMTDEVDLLMTIQHTCNSRRREAAARFELGTFYERTSVQYVTYNVDITNRSDI